MEGAVRVHALLAPVRSTRNQKSMFARQRHTVWLLALICASLLVVSGPLAAQQQRPAAVARRDSSIIALARAQLGRRYIFGGTRPETGFDCSGLVGYLMRAVGVRTPRTADEIAHAGREVPRDISKLRVGDILTFSFGTQRISHVGIYIGNGRYIHAATRSRGIVESSLTRPGGSSILRAWRGVRRFIDTDSSASVAVR